MSFPAPIPPIFISGRERVTGFMGAEANLRWISATDLCCGPKYQLAHPLAELQCFHHPGKEPSELLQQLALIGGENSNILKSKGSFHK